MQTDALIEQLSTLVLPIAALLEHPDFTPDTDKSPELVGLFRNMWFLCILFHFTRQHTTESDDWSRSAQREALSHISTKTPPLVREEDHDYVTSALEYNSVIRHDYAQNVSCFNQYFSSVNLLRFQAITYHKDILTKYFPLRGSEIRYLHPGQIIFLLTMHDMETMRSSAGLSSSLVTYFVNSSLNNQNAMSTCMDSIAEKVRVIDIVAKRTAHAENL